MNAREAELVQALRDLYHTFESCVRDADAWQSYKEARALLTRIEQENSSETMRNFPLTGNES